MVELILSWVFLFVGIANFDEPLWFLVSGVFAIALNINRLVDWDK